MNIRMKNIWTVAATLAVFVLAAPIQAAVINDFEGTAGNAKDWGSGNSIDVDPDYSYESTIGVTSGSQSVHLSNVAGWAQTLALALDYEQRVDFMANSVFSIDVSVPANHINDGSGGWTKIESITLNAEGYGFVEQAGTDHLFGFWDNSPAQTVTLSFNYSDAKSAMPAIPGYIEIIITTNSDGAHTNLYFDNAQLFGGTGTLGAYEDEVLADTPVLYLRLEENTAVSSGSGNGPLSDSSGNDYWAVHRANTQFVAGGGIGNCRYLPDVGNQNLIGTGNAAVFDWTFDFNDNHAFAPDDITFEFWFNSDANDLNPYAIFFQQVKDRSYQAPGMSNSGGTFRILSGDPNAAEIAAGTQRWWYTNVTTPIDGQWHQVAVTYQESYGTVDEMAIQLYLDGDLAASTVVGDPTRPAKLGPEFDHVGIGGANDVGYSYNNYKGLIDEFAIYAGALSADRIAVHYAAGMCAMSQGDITGDCKIDMADFAVLAASWLGCNDPALFGTDPDCGPTW